MQTNLSSRNHKLTFIVNTFWFCTAVFLLFSSLSFGQHQVKSSSIESKYLKRQLNYSVMLPVDYRHSAQEYPVIFLLHGIDGEGADWIERCSIKSIADSLLKISAIGEYIYIMPDAENSYYINNYDSSSMYMDYFIEELIPAIDSLYPTTKSARDRALLGLSMGGFGAIIMAVKNPEYFGTVMAMSAAVRNESIFISLPQGKYNYFFGKIFGPGLEGKNRITEHWKENSPYTLMNAELARDLAEKHWYIDCGADDHLLPASAAFHELLNQSNIPHEYHIRPGTHNGEYWRKTTIQALTYFNRTQLNLSTE